MEKTTLYNRENQSINICSVNVSNISIPVTIHLTSGEYIEYATLDNFIILPDGKSRITQVTYFPITQKLAIDLKGSNLGRGLKIYVPEKIPVAVISENNLNWTFNQTTKIIDIIRLDKTFEGRIDVYLVDSINDIKYIEDLEDVEILDYKTSLLREELEKSQSILDKLKNYLSKLQGDK